MVCIYKNENVMFYDRVISVQYFSSNYRQDTKGYAIYRDVEIELITIYNTITTYYLQELQ